MADLVMETMLCFLVVNFIPH